MYKKTIIIGTVLILAGCTSELADKLGQAAIDGFKSGLTGKPIKIDKNSKKQTVSNAKKDSLLTKPTKKVEIDISDAIKSYNAKDYQSSINYLVPLCTKDIGTACTLLGKSYLMKGQMSQAIETLDKACNLNDYEGCEAIALNYYLANNYEKAEPYATKTCILTEDKEREYISCSMYAYILEKKGYPYSARSSEYFDKSCQAGKMKRKDGKARFIRPADLKEICALGKSYHDFKEKTKGMSWVNKSKMLGLVAPVGSDTEYAIKYKKELMMRNGASEVDAFTWAEAARHNLGGGGGGGGGSGHSSSSSSSSKSGCHYEIQTVYAPGTRRMVQTKVLSCD